MPKTPFCLSQINPRRRETLGSLRATWGIQDAHHVELLTIPEYLQLASQVEMEEKKQEDIKKGKPPAGEFIATEKNH